MVTNTPEGRYSLPATALNAAGYKVWDGVNLSVRKQIPGSVHALRIVQYESYRGLEGWTVFALGLDDFWDRKKEEALQRPDLATDLFIDQEEDAKLQAWRWAMIPISRPINTLVINITKRESEVKEALIRLREQISDIAEWVTIPLSSTASLAEGTALH